MYFRQILHDDQSCASYVIGCPSLGQCAVIDPQGDPQRYVEAVEDNAMVVSHVMDTHVHADHLSSARALATRTGARLLLGAGADVDFDFEPLRDGDVIPVGNRSIRVLHTPGHTPEHVCLLVDDWFVLTGDTLFVGDVGRVDLALHDVPDGELVERARDLHASLARLMELEDHVEVYPGHYAGSTCGRGLDGKAISTVGRERRMNAPLSMTIDGFIDFQSSDVPPLPEDFHRIKRRNVGREPDGAPAREGDDALAPR